MKKNGNGRPESLGCECDVKGLARLSNFFTFLVRGFIDEKLWQDSFRTISNCLAFGSVLFLLSKFGHLWNFQIGYGWLEMVALGLLVLIIMVCWLVGRKILRFLRIDVAEGGEELVFSLCLGLGILAYLMFILGMLGGLYKWLVIAILFLLAIMGASELKGMAGRFKPVFLKESLKPLIVILAAILGVHLLFTLFGALAPPTDWDGLSYHLAIPKIYIQNHRVLYIPYISHANFPQTFEMFYTVGLLLKGPELAKLFHFLAGSLLLVAIYAFGRRYFSSQIGLMSACIFYAMPLAAYESSCAYVDLGLALFMFLALYAFFNWGYTERRGWLVLMGVLMGFSMGIKYTGGLVFLLILPVLMFKLWRKKGSIVQKLKLFLIFLLVAVVIALPWYLKTYLYTGNPVWPFWYEIFGGRNWSSGCAQAYADSLRSFGMGRSILSYVLLPWNVTMHYQKFGAERNLCLAISPLLIGLLPALVLLKKNKNIIYLLVFVWDYVTFWFLLSQQVRLLLPALVPLAIVAGYAGDGIVYRGGYFRVVGLTLIIFCLWVNLFLVVLLNWGTMGYGFKADYLLKRLPIYPAFEYINELLPKDAKVIFYGETRGFWCDREYMWGDPGHHMLIDYEKLSDAVDLFKEFKRFSISHVLVNTRYFRLWQGTSSVSRWLRDGIEGGYLKELFYENGVYVFEIAWDKIGR